MLNVGEIRNAKQKEPKDGALTPGAPYVSDFNSTQKKSVSAATLTMRMSQRS